MSEDTTKQTTELYDKISSDYDSHIATTGHYQAQEQLFEKLKGYFQEPILDLAAGPGFLVGLLLKSDLKVIANDGSTSMVQLLSEKLRDNSKAMILNQDANHISLEHKTRTILCSNLFYYLRNRKAAIQNWLSNLEDAGHIVIFEEYPFQKSKTGPLSKHEKDLEELVSPLSPDELREKFIDCGLKLVESADTPIDSEHSLYGSVFKK